MQRCNTKRLSTAGLLLKAGAMAALVACGAGGPEDAAGLEASATEQEARVKPSCAVSPNPVAKGEFGRVTIYDFPSSKGAINWNLVTSCDPATLPEGIRCPLAHGTISTDQLGNIFGSSGPVGVFNYSNSAAASGSIVFWTTASILKGTPHREVATCPITLL